MMRTGKSHAGRVNLTKYVKVHGAASETWRFCPVVYTSNRCRTFAVLRGHQ